MSDYYDPLSGSGLKPEALAILCECDPSYDPVRRFEYCGRVRSDAYRIVNAATSAELAAVRALAKGGKRRLVMALAALDMDARRTVDTYSHAAAATDRAVLHEKEATAGEPMARGRGQGYGSAPMWSIAEDTPAVRAAKLAVKKARRAEEEALEELTAPATVWGGLRRRLLAAIRAKGVKIVGGDNPCIGVVSEHAICYRSWDALQHFPQYPEHNQLRERMVSLGLLSEQGSGLQDLRDGPG